jgi:hypothetical protein
MYTSLVAVNTRYKYVRDNSIAESGEEQSQRIGGGGGDTVSFGESNLQSIMNPNIAPAPNVVSPATNVRVEPHESVVNYELNEPVVNVVNPGKNTSSVLEQP